MSLRFVLFLAGAGVLLPMVAMSDDLTRDAAVGRALASNPTLQAARAAIGAAEQQAKLEGMRPPLTVGAELENFAGTGSLSGLDSAETTVRLGRTFELGGKREARLAVGGARVAQQKHDAALARLEGRVALDEVLARFPEWDVDWDNARRAPTSTVRGWESLPVSIA